MEMAAEAAVAPAGRQDSCDAGPSSSAKCKAASCMEAVSQRALLDESKAADADGEKSASALAPVSGRSTAAVLEAAGSPSGGEAEPKCETLESSLQGSDVKDCKDRQEDAEPRCQARVPQQVAEYCCGKPSSVWCFQLWPGGLTRGDSKAKSDKEGCAPSCRLKMMAQLLHTLMVCAMNTL